MTTLPLKQTHRSREFCRDCFSLGTFTIKSGIQMNHSQNHLRMAWRVEDHEPKLVVNANLREDFVGITCEDLESLI